MVKDNKIPKNNIKEIRKQRGLTQARLAELAGIDESEVSMLENSRRALSGKRIITLTKALKCTVPELFGDENYKVDDENIDDKLLDDVMVAVKEYARKKDITLTKELFTKAVMVIYNDAHSQSAKELKLIDTSLIDNVISLEKVRNS